MPLRNTEKRSARKIAVGYLLMKLRLWICHQVLANLFSIKDERPVSHVFHSARKALVEYFVPDFLAFEHIKRRDVYRRPLASEFLADQPDRAIFILDGTYMYIYLQKSYCNDQPQTKTLEKTDVNNYNNSFHCIMRGTLLRRL